MKRETKLSGISEFRLYHCTTEDSTIVTKFYFFPYIFSDKPNGKCLLRVLNRNNDSQCANSYIRKYFV